MTAIGRFLCAVLIFFSMLSPEVASAAQKAVVQIHEAPVYATPGGRVLGRLSQGQRVDASNQPTNGYYKIRTASGKTGWVAAAALGLPGDAPVAGTGETYRRFRVSALGGLNLFSATEFNSLLEFNALNNGLGLGVEAGWFFAPRWAAMIRWEWISKSVLATDASSNQYEIDILSLPLMAGVMVQLLETGKFKVNLSAFGGLGVSTLLRSNALGVASPSVTQFSGLPFTGLARAGVEWAFTPALSVFAEAGYRLLSLPSKTPDEPIGNGGDIFQQSGSYVPLPLNLNGLVLSGGVTLSF